MKKIKFLLLFITIISNFTSICAQEIWYGSPTILDYPSQNSDVDIFNLGGKPAICFFRHYPREVRIMTSLDSIGDSWGSYINASSSLPAGQGSSHSIAKINGIPAISAISNFNIYYCPSSDSLGLNWPNNHYVSTVGGTFLDKTYLTDVNGYPAIIYIDRAVNCSIKMYYKIAQNSQGTAWFSPVLLKTFNNCGYSPLVKLTMVDGKPNVIFTSGARTEMAKGVDSLGMSWTTSSVFNNSVSLVNVQNINNYSYLGIINQNKNFEIHKREISSNNWLFMDSVVLQGSNLSNANFKIVNNKFFFSYSYNKYPMNDSLRISFSESLDSLNWTIDMPIDEVSWWSFSDIFWHNNAYCIAYNKPNGILKYKYSIDTCYNTVISTNDYTLGCLRYAVQCANPNDTIFIDPDLLGDSIDIFTEKIIIDKNLTFMNLGVNKLNLILNNNIGLFKILDGVTLTFSNFKVISTFSGNYSIIFNEGNLNMENLTIVSKQNNLPILNMGNIVLEGDIEIINNN